MTNSGIKRDHSRKVPPLASDMIPLAVTAAGYLMLTNMPQAAASAAPVKTTTGFSQNVLP